MAFIFIYACHMAYMNAVNSFAVMVFIFKKKMFFVKYMVKREFTSTWVISHYENRQLQDLGKAFFYNVSQVILEAFTFFVFFANCFL